MFKRLKYTSLAAFTLLVALPVSSAGYDAALADELGTDEYGVKKYVMALLKCGSNRSQSDVEARRL